MNIRERLHFNSALGSSDIKAAKSLADVAVGLKLAADALHKIRKCILGQARFCEEKVLALRLRGSFSSLPNEILAVVLVDAATPTSDEFQYKHHAMCVFRAATRLSHVCQRFRSLMLCNPNFWRCVWNGMSLDVVETLFG